jgi:hypothetical protein
MVSAADLDGDGGDDSGGGDADAGTDDRWKSFSTRGGDDDDDDGIEIIDGRS